MHRPASRRKAAGSACTCWSTGTLRIAAWSARTLEDRTATLNDAGTGGCAGAWRCNWPRWRGAVDRPGTGLRHNHTPDRRCRRSWGLGRLWHSYNRRSFRRGSDRGRSRRRCSRKGNRGWRRRSCRSNGRTRHHRIHWRCRGNRRTLRCCRRSRRCSRHWRSSHHGAGGRLRCNRRSRRRRRGDDGRRLARLRHDDAARRRSFDLGRSDGHARSWSCGRDRSRRSLRRCGRLRRRRRRNRWTWRWAFCLFLALLNRLQDISRLGHPRPVNFLGCPAVALGRA
jgi:hypothetical protein